MWCRLTCVVALVLSSAVLTSGTSGADEIDIAALAHDSHSDVYRTPFNDVHPGSRVVLRFRTAHDDVARVQLWQSNSLRDMSLVARNTHCYAPAYDGRCDFWQIAIRPTELGEINYAFLIDNQLWYSDASYPYGGIGTVSESEPDTSYLIHVVRNIPRIPWLANGVMYQVFPDRFRNGDPANDPSPDEPRYDDTASAQIQPRPWTSLPEGFCRAHVDAPCDEEPLGRDFFGGDLDGIRQRLGYLDDLGITVLYLNPIFAASSNHYYDVRDHRKVSDWLGGDHALPRLIDAAHARGIRIILDGAFDAVSSDSPFFDRYGHFDVVGACESRQSPYRDWFTFRDADTGPCVGSEPGKRAMYESWGGVFDALPLLDKENRAVRNYSFGAARQWLRQGADGWRLDSMHDPSFPLDYWREFRDVVKEVKPDAPLIGEAFNNSMPLTRGDMADTEMGYRFWWAAMSLLGGTDDGSSAALTNVRNQFTSIQQDYSSATARMYMNLLSTHDTARALWRLTPGENNREQKEYDAANLAVGKQRALIAATLQFTMPGTPSIYYGDELGRTGDNDPDDRRTFDGTGDQRLLAAYQRLISLRTNHSVLRNGDLTFLQADGALAYGMRNPTSAAVVVVNRDDTARTVRVPTTGWLRDGVTFRSDGDTVRTRDGAITVSLPPLTARVYLATRGQDLTTPDAPAVKPGLEWTAVDDATRYVVERSPFTGGGYRRMGTTTGTRFPVSQQGFYVVRAVDAAGNVGRRSAEVHVSRPPAARTDATLDW